MILSRRLAPGIKVVAHKEYGQEKENRGVGFDSNQEVVELRLPRQRTWQEEFRSVSKNHLVWISHQEWDDNSNEHKDRMRSRRKCALDQVKP